MILVYARGCFVAFLDIYIGLGCFMNVSYMLDSQCFVVGWKYKHVGMPCASIIVDEILQYCLESYTFQMLSSSICCSIIASFEMSLGIYLLYGVEFA